MGLVAEDLSFFWKAVGLVLEDVGLVGEDELGEYRVGWVGCQVGLRG